MKFLEIKAAIVYSGEIHSDRIRRMETMHKNQYGNMVVKMVKNNSEMHTTGMERNITPCSAATVSRPAATDG